MNRVMCACVAKGMSLSKVAEKLGIAPDILTIYKNPTAPINIDLANKIAVVTGVPAYFICGMHYRITRPMSDWIYDEKEDYENMDTLGQEYLYFLYGKGQFTETTLEPPKVSNVKIAIVDGRDDDSEMLDVVLTYPESKEDETNQNDDNPKT